MVCARIELYYPIALLLASPQYTYSADRPASFIHLASIAAAFLQDARYTVVCACCYMCQAACVLTHTQATHRRMASFLLLYCCFTAAYRLYYSFTTCLTAALPQLYCSFTAALLQLYSGIVGKNILDDGQSECDRVSLSLCSSLSLIVSLSLCLSLSLVSGRVPLSLDRVSLSLARKRCLISVSW